VPLNEQSLIRTVLLDVGIPPRLMHRAQGKWYRQQHDAQQEADAHLKAVGSVIAKDHRRDVTVQPFRLNAAFGVGCILV
jgi:hypothetical protein